MSDRLRSRCSALGPRRSENEKVSPSQDVYEDVLSEYIGKTLRFAASRGTISCSMRLCDVLSSSHCRPAQDVYEDVLSEYIEKTVTVDPHPHTGTPTVSIHPCKHSLVMKKAPRRVLKTDPCPPMVMKQGSSRGDISWATRCIHQCSIREVQTLHGHEKAPPHGFCLKPH